MVSNLPKYETVNLIFRLESCPTYIVFSSAFLAVRNLRNTEFMRFIFTTFKSLSCYLVFYRTFKIDVKDSNDVPTSVLIDGKTYEEVPENSLAATVGTLFAVDEDKNQSHIFSVVGNDSSFVVNGRVLKLADGVSFDYETKSVYTVLINVTDNGVPRASSVSSILVNVINVNEAPTDMMLSRTDIDENSIEGSVVANITVIDPDDVLNKSGNYHTCILTDSANGRFKIVGGLTLSVGSGELNYERQYNHSVTLQCSDGELTLTKTFTINVNDINEVPTRVLLSNNKVAENIQGRNSIGVLSTTDPDNLVSNRQSFTYRIFGNDSRFEVSGNTLYSKVPFDYEATPILLVVVSSTDNGKRALTRVERIRIEIVDKNDEPKDISVCTLIVFAYVIARFGTARGKLLCISLYEFIFHKLISYMI